MATKITYADKSSGDQVTASDLNQIKVAANGGIDDAAAALAVGNTAQSTASAAQPKETGKGLSKNDFTDTLKTKLDGLTQYTDANVRSTALTGVVTGNGGTPTAADTVLTFAGKVINFIANILTTILSSQLTGYVIGTNSALSATDTILAAFGKLQAQINAIILRFTPISRTGGVIRFDTAANYNDLDSPFTGQFSFDFNGAVVGVDARLYLNVAAYTLPTGCTKVAGTFSAGQINEFYFTYLGNNKVALVIRSNNGGNYTNPETDFYSLVTSNNSVTATPILGLQNIVLPAGKSYIDTTIRVDTLLAAGGYKIGVVYPSDVTKRSLSLFGNASGTLEATIFTKYQLTVDVLTPNAGLGRAARSDNFVRIWGEVETAAGGNLSFIFASFVAAQTVAVETDNKLVVTKR